MEYFPKVWFFGKVSPQHLLILLKVKGEPLPRKLTYKFFSQMTPARAVRSKAEEELVVVLTICFDFEEGLPDWLIFS